jgi:hypothetical protein
MIGDCVYYCLSLIDASATGEPTEEGYYQEEEEEDYPGHFANQGKPSFESYPTCLVFTIAFYLFLSKLHD